MKHRIIIPLEINHNPYPHEMFAARAMVDYFSTNVIFQKRYDTTKSADFKINNTVWEVKSPIGDSKRTMQNNLRIADGQSQNIIINLVRCKMKTERALSRLQYELGKANNIKRLLVVLKNGKVLVLK